MPGWIQTCEVDETNPLTQIVSNEEFVQPDQTVEQKGVEHHLLDYLAANRRRRGTIYRGRQVCSNACRRAV